MYKRQVKHDLVSHDQITNWIIARFIESPDRWNWRCFYSPSVVLPDDSRLVGKSSYINTLSFDLDDVSLAEAKRRCREVGLLPMYFVESGGGVHIYIALDGVYLDGEENWRDIFNGINDLLGGDKGSSYRQGYLRTLPWTLNAKPKYGSPRLVKLHKADKYKRYNIEELREIVGHSEKPREPSLLITPAPAFWKEQEDLEREGVRWLGVLKRDWKLRAIVNGEDERIKAAPSGSERDFIYALALFTRGFSPVFVYNRLLDWDWGIAKNSRRGELTEAEIERRLKCTIKAAPEKLDLRYVVLTAMEANRRYTAEALARKVRLNIAQTKHALKQLCTAGFCVKIIKKRRGKVLVLYERAVKSEIITSLCQST